jgi:hypothetical protein
VAGRDRAVVPLRAADRFAPGSPVVAFAREVVVRFAVPDAPVAAFAFAGRLAAGRAAAASGAACSSRSVRSPSAAGVTRER